MASVHADVTGSVWQIAVEVGQVVAVDDELAILESMKMEIPVVTPLAGRVAEIHVSLNEPVKEGQLLFSIEADGS